MREIKFRTWTGQRFWFFDITSGFNNENNDKFSEPEQYIGKKDRFGKEIFDGDIIKDCFGRIFTIFFCDDHSRWEMRGDKKDGFNYGVHISDWFDGLSDLPEIIGNIHQEQSKC